MSLAISYPLWIKVLLVLLSFTYIIYILFKVEGISFRIKKGLDVRAFWRRTATTFAVIAVLTSGYVWNTDASALFYVMLHKPQLFAGILIVYTIVSVWPQEIIYRTFFFKRYETLFRSKYLFIFFNAILFSLAHIFFKNTLVLVLTFLGGLIFGLTYFKFRSTTLVSIEHAIYGNWLFTVGMGQMLGFPGMES
jgi:hypothetical protein